MTHEAGLKAAVKAFWEHPIANGAEDTKEVEAAIQAYLSASGMALVPREPTYAMEDAADLSEPGWGSDIYRAMISAAPDPFKSKP